MSEELNQKQHAQPENEIVETSPEQVSTEISNEASGADSQSPETTASDEVAEAAASNTESATPEASTADGDTPAADENTPKAKEAFALEHPPTPPAPEPKKVTKDKKEKQQEEASQSPFTITVGQVYDGPFDLLLDLIRKQNIDIYDIPIAKITAQFLEYTHHLKQTDVDAAGEFIYTASLLIHIKSKTLLPRDPSEIAGPDSDDPRRELVERLLEHERFKAAAQMLQQKQMLEEASWSQPGMKKFLTDSGMQSTDAEREIDADTASLLFVFRDILNRLRERPVHSIDEESVTVAQMIQFVKKRLLMDDRPVSLRKLLGNTKTERGLICAFLAMLELVRLQAIWLRQGEALSDIFIKKADNFDDVMENQAAVRDDWS